MWPPCKVVVRWIDTVCSTSNTLTRNECIYTRVDTRAASGVHSCFPRSVPARYERRCLLRCHVIPSFGSYTSTDRRVFSVPFLYECAQNCTANARPTDRLLTIQFPVERRKNSSFVNRSSSTLFRLATHRGSFLRRASDIDRVILREFSQTMSCVFPFFETVKPD